MRELTTGIDWDHILCEAEKCQLACGPHACSSLHPSLAVSESTRKGACFCPPEIHR